MANKIDKTDITVIIPVHELNDITKKLFANAVKSVDDQFVKPDSLMIVIPKSLKEFMTEFDFKELSDIVKIEINDGETDFPSQLNFGVSKVKTKWFSLLEYDDEFSKIWIKNANLYKNTYTDVDMFLPFIVDVDEEGAFLGLTNEAVWAAEFSDEMGILDNSSLLAYQNFNFDGMVMTKENYEDMGGLKPSMKLTFIYEFLLRITHFSSRVMVIPKFGYKHVNQRDGSLFSNYRKELSADEARWWMATAKKECFHNIDRKITYKKG